MLNRSVSLEELRRVIGILVDNPFPTPEQLQDSWARKKNDQEINTLRRRTKRTRKHFSRKFRVNKATGFMNRADDSALEAIALEIRLLGWYAYASETHGDKYIVVTSYAMDDEGATLPVSLDLSRQLLINLADEPMIYPHGINYRTKTQIKDAAKRHKSLHGYVMKLHNRVDQAIKAGQFSVPTADIDPDAVAIVQLELQVFGWNAGLYSSDLRFTS